MRTNRIAFLVSLCVSLAVGAAPALAVTYSVVDLTPAGFNKAILYGTAGGQQIGFGRSDANGLNEHAILWSGTAASAVDLNPAGFTWSHANAIAGGQQIGLGIGEATGGYQHALLWTGTADSVVDLHPTAITGLTGPQVSQAIGLAAGGQVGFASGDSTGGNWHGVLWSGTAASAIDLNPAGFTVSIATRIRGDQQLGWGWIDDANHSHAILWSGTAASAVDLNPAGFSWTKAGGIDGNRQVGSGFNDAAGSVHAVLWTGTAQSAVDLNPAGFDSSQASDIRGNLVIGWGSLATSGSSRALAWSCAGGGVTNLHNLLGPGYQYSSAFAVGEDGDIVGYGVDVSGVQHAILWRPVPGPGTVAGDANFDDKVDLQDFGALKDHFNTTAGASWGMGDFNGDGAVDLQDFGILKDHFGQTPGSGTGLTSIPEPATVSLLALGAGALFKRRPTP